MSSLLAVGAVHQEGPRYLEGDYRGLEFRDYRGDIGDIYRLYIYIGVIQGLDRVIL